MYIYIYIYLYIHIYIIIYIYILVGPVTAKHLYKKRCSEGGLEGWQGGWPGSPIIGANLGTHKLYFKFFDI